MGSQSGTQSDAGDDVRDCSRERDRIPADDQQGTDAEGSNKENDASQVKSASSNGSSKVVKPDPDEDEDDDVVFRESPALKRRP